MQKMGNLKPGANYSYRKINGVTYSQEEGSIKEEAVGWDYDPRTSDGRPLHEHIKESYQVSYYFIQLQYFALSTYFFNKISTRWVWSVV